MITNKEEFYKEYLEAVKLDIDHTIGKGAVKEIKDYFLLHYPEIELRLFLIYLGSSFVLTDGKFTMEDCKLFSEVADLENYPPDAFKDQLTMYYSEFDLNEFIDTYNTLPQDIKLACLNFGMFLMARKGHFSDEDKAFLDRFI